MTFTRLRLLLLIVLGGAVINSMIGAALAIWQPPWRHENAQSDLLGYQRENEQILRERIEFDETFPQRLRRSAHYRATAVDGFDVTALPSAATHAAYHPPRSAEPHECGADRRRPT